MKIVLLCALLASGCSACAAKVPPLTQPASDLPSTLWVGTYEDIIATIDAVCWQEAWSVPAMACLPIGKVLQAIDQFGERRPGHAGPPAAPEDARR